MAVTTTLTKRTLISKANSSMVIATSVATFVVIFSLVACRTLASQASYQNKVISGKKTALKQLKADLDARDTLVSSYKAFVDTPQNVLGGDPNGNGPQDGDNAKLILDSLPSKYDFPALTTSIEKIITSQSLRIQNITGTDDEVAQQNNQTSVNPQPLGMPFQLTVTGSYQSIQNLAAIFQASIRPFQIQMLELTGDENSMTATITAQTYYQPEKSLKFKTEVVR